MCRRRASQLLGILLFLSSFQCFAQKAPSHQQEIDLHARQAQKFLQEKRPDLAIPEFRSIVALDPKNVDALGNLGVLLVFQGNYADALSPLRQALKLRPGLSKIEALLGMAEKRTGDYNNAREHLAKAFPNIEEEKIKIQAGMELIELYSGTGDLEKAATIVDTLVSTSPTNPQILYAAYRIHSDLSSQAMLTLTMVAPHSALMHQLMAHELVKQGDTAGAIRNYREALKIDPSTPGLHFELAEMLNSSLSEAGRKEAEEEYKAALAVNSLDEKSECRLGDLALLRNDLQTASVHYSRALQLQPNDAEAALGLAKTLMDMNQPQKAEPLLEHAVAVDPTSAVAHFRLSTVYRQSGRTADAKRELQEYQKYKAMKDKLKDIYREMRLQPSKQERDESEIPKQQ
jgi:tetratricopeptide (TPR) repeat protein